MMILDPELAKKDLDSLIQDIKKDLGETQLNVVKEDVWGNKDMAYAINGSRVGHYLVYTIETEATDSLKKITTPLNIKKGLWRYMFTANEQT